MSGYFPPSPGPGDQVKGQRLLYLPEMRATLLFKSGQGLYPIASSAWLAEAEFREWHCFLVPPHSHFLPPPAPYPSQESTQLGEGAGGYASLFLFLSDWFRRGEELLLPASSASQTLPCFAVVSLHSQRLSMKWRQLLLSPVPLNLIWGRCRESFLAAPLSLRIRRGGAGTAPFAFPRSGLYPSFGKAWRVGKREWLQMFVLLPLLEGFLISSRNESLYAA